MYRRVLPAVAYVALIFVVSSIPSLTAPGPRFLSPDKIAHLVEYSLLGALLFKAGAGRLGSSRWVEFLFLVAVGASVGALDEVYQGYVPGRQMSIPDWYADVIGTIVGLTVMRVWRSRATTEGSKA